MGEPLACFRPVRFASIDSTNTEIRRRLEVGTAFDDRGRSVVVVAARQTAGYGRQGRTWISPEGGLYLSFALPSPENPAQAPSLSPAVSLGVYRAFARLGCVDCSIKWPNDIVCAKGKLCGISLELFGGHLCVGVGTNVFRPTRQLSVGGKNTPAYLDECMSAKPADAVAFFEQVLTAELESIGAVLEEWHREGFAGLKEEYERGLGLMGKHVSMELVDGRRYESGTVVGVDENARLLLREDDASAGAEPCAVSSGEAHLL